MKPAGHDLVFSDLDPIFWDPNSGGFLRRHYQMSIRSSSLIDPRFKKKTNFKLSPNQNYPSAISSAELIIGPYTQTESTLGVNTFQVLYKNKRVKSPLTPGAPLAIISPSPYASRVADPDSGSYGYEQTTLDIYLTRDLDQFIEQNYTLFEKDGFIKFSARIVLNKKYGGALLIAQGTIQVHLIPSLHHFKPERALSAFIAHPSRSYSFAEDIFSHVQGIESSTQETTQYLPSHQDEPRTLSLLGNLPDSPDIRDISFYSPQHGSPLVAVPYQANSSSPGLFGKGQKQAGVSALYRVSPSLYLQAFKSYNPKSTQTHTYTTYTQGFVQAQASPKYIGKLPGQPVTVSLPPKLSVIPQDLRFVNPQDLPNADTLSLSIRGKNLEDITSPELIIYHAQLQNSQGAPDSISARQLVDQVISAGSSHSPIHRNQTTYLFNVHSNVKNLLARFTNSGILSIALRYVDGKTQDTITISAPSLYLHFMARGSSRPIVEALQGNDLTGPFHLVGRHLDGFYDGIGVDLFYDEPITGGIQAETFHLDVREAEERTAEGVSFRISPSHHALNYLRSGRFMTARAYLTRKSKELYATHAYTTVRPIADSSTPTIEGLEIVGTGLIHGRAVQLTARHGFDIEVAGEIAGFLFKPGTVPVDVLSIPKKDNLSIPGLVGTLSFNNTPTLDPYGVRRLWATPTITDATEASKIDRVDVVVARTLAPTSQAGRYVAYAVLRNVPLLSSYYEDYALTQNTPTHPWQGWNPYDFYVFAHTYSNTASYAAGAPLVSSFPIRAGLPNNTESLGSYFIDYRANQIAETTSGDGVHWRLAGARVLDQDFIKKHGRRYHGPAVVEYNMRDPFTSSRDTASVFVHREPCIESVGGRSSGTIQLDSVLPHGLLTVSGYGFISKDWVRNLNNSGSVYVSAVNGVTYYDRETKAPISHLPYTTEVIKYPDGREEFAIKIIGAAPVQLVTSSGRAQRAGYFVVSTDDGSDWLKVNLECSSESEANYYAGNPNVSSTVSDIQRGDVVGVSVRNLVNWGTGTWRSSVRWSDALISPTRVQNVENYSKYYLRYSGSIIEEYLCVPVGWNTSSPTYTGSGTFGNGTIYLTFEDLSSSFSTSYYETFDLNILGTAPIVSLGKISIHPGTSRSGAGHFTGKSIGSLMNLTKETVTFSGAEVTQAYGLRATHRSLYYDVDVTLSTTSYMFSTADYAFYTSSTDSSLVYLPSSPDYESTTAGGVCSIYAYSEETVSNYVRWYSIAHSSSDIAQEITAYGYQVFEQLGSFGSDAWALSLGGRKNTQSNQNRYVIQDRGCAVLGATNVPFGLFSIDKESTQAGKKTSTKKRAITKLAHCGKPKVSVQGSSDRYAYSPKIRFDTPFETAVRPPLVSTSSLYRDIVDGNAVSPLWEQNRSFVAKPEQAYEALTLLTYNANPGTAHVSGRNGVLGNTLKAQVELLDLSNPLITEDPLRSDGLHTSSRVMDQYIVPCEPLLENSSYARAQSSYPAHLGIAGQGHVGVINKYRAKSAVGISGTRVIGIRSGATSSGEVYDDSVYGTSPKRWTADRFSNYPYRAFVYSAPDPKSTTVSDTQLLAIFSQDETSGEGVSNVLDSKYAALPKRSIYSSVPNTTTSVMGSHTITSNPLQVDFGTISRQGQSRRFMLLNSLRTSPRGQEGNVDYTFPYVSGAVRPQSIEVISGGNRHSIEPKTGILHPEAALIDGHATTRITPEVGAEFGSTEKFFVYNAIQRGRRTANRADWFFTQTGPHGPVHLLPGLKLNKPLVRNNQENILTGLRRSPELVRLVLLARVQDGLTIPITELSRSKSQVRFTPVYLGDYFDEGEEVRVGVQYESGAIDLGDTIYHVYNISATTNSKTVEYSGFQSMTVHGDEGSSLRFELDPLIEPMEMIALEVPIVLTPRLDEKIRLNAFIFNRPQSVRGLQYIELNPTGIQKSFLFHGKRMNLFGILDGGQHVRTTNYPAVISKNHQHPLDSNAEILIDTLPAPKLAPSYSDTTSGASFLDENNPKAIHHEFVYWSKSVTCSVLDYSHNQTVSTYTASVSWPEAISYGAGLRVAGQHLILRKDEYDHLTPYEDMSRPASLVNFEAIFPANIFYSSSATASEAYISSITHPKNGYTKVGVKGLVSSKMVNKTWYRPIYSKNSEIHTDSQQTEWQEVNLTLQPGRYADEPPSFVYGGLGIHSSLVSAQGYPSWDGFLGDDLAEANIKYVNLDEHWALYTPYPVIDHHTRYEAAAGSTSSDNYRETTDGELRVLTDGEQRSLDGGLSFSDSAYGSEHDIWPKSIARGHGQAVIRITGRNLIGNLNHQYQTTSGNTIRTFANVEPVKVWLHHTPSDTKIYATSSEDLNHSLWGDEGGNNSARIYAYFQFATSSISYVDTVYSTFSSTEESVTASTYIPSGHYRLCIETKWAAGDSIYTLSTYSENAIYVTSSPHMEMIDPRIAYLPNITYNTWDLNHDHQTVSTALSNRVRPLVYSMVAHYPYAATSTRSTIHPYHPSLNNDICSSYLATGMSLSLYIAHSETNVNFTSSGDTTSRLESHGYEVMTSLATQWSLFDEYMAIDANVVPGYSSLTHVRPIVFASPSKVGGTLNDAANSWYTHTSSSVKPRTAIWCAYQQPDLYLSTADVAAGTTSLNGYHVALQSALYNYGIQPTGKTYSHVSYHNLAVTASRGAYTHRIQGLTYHSGFMPRITYIAGTSVDNIVNTHENASSGTGVPRVDIVLEDQGRRSVTDHKGFDTYGPAFTPQGIAVLFGDQGRIFIPVGQSSYGRIYLMKYGLKTILSWVPNKAMKDLLGRMRTKGWVDISVIYDMNYDIRNGLFRTFRIGWTPWDQPATTGDSVANNPSEMDATLYGLRLIGKGDELRAAFYVNFNGKTYEVSHQEPLIYEKDMNHDWFVLAGSARYDKINNVSKIALYGANEKMMYTDLSQGDPRAFTKPTEYNLLYNGLFED